MGDDPYGRGAAEFLLPRCHRCNRLLALVIVGAAAIRCPRCKALNRWGDVAVPKRPA